MHFMNRQRARHMGAEPQADGHGEHGGGQDQHATHVPHIHIHPEHDSEGNHVKTHVHVMHHDGQHEHSEHEASDTEGVKSVIDQHLAPAGEQRPEEMALGEEHGDGLAR